MTTWSTNARFVFLVGCCASLPGATPLFIDRALQAHDSYYAEDRLRSSIAKEISDEYGTLLPNKSLLVHDCSNTDTKWCVDPFFSLSKVFARAATLAGLDPDVASRAWYELAKGQAFELTEPIALNILDDFQMLAVVNRMDLATWSGYWNGSIWKNGIWQKPELRFIFGPKPGRDGDAPRYTLILEFVLPDLDWTRFKSAAQGWEELSHVDDAHYNAALQRVVMDSGWQRSSIVRIRVNKEIVLNTTWKFGQWEFRNKMTRLPDVKAFEQTSLDDEFNSAVTLPSNENYGRYNALWLPPLPHPLDRIAIPREWWQPVRGYILEDAGMRTPPGITDPNRRVRNIISIQRCSGCHGTESDTKFVHVSNRDAQHPSELSGFLQGVNNPKPKLADLINAVPGKVLSFKVKYCTSEDPPPTAPSTCTDTSQRLTFEERRFHDLGRRLLFLASLLAAPAVPEMGSPASIEEYGTVFPH